MKLLLASTTTTFAVLSVIASYFVSEPQDLGAELGDGLATFAAAILGLGASPCFLFLMGPLLKRTPRFATSVWVLTCAAHFAVLILNFASLEQIIRMLGQATAMKDRLGYPLSALMFASSMFAGLRSKRLLWGNFSKPS